MDYDFSIHGRQLHRSFKIKIHRHYCNSSSGAKDAIIKGKINLGVPNIRDPLFLWQQARQIADQQHPG